MRPLVLGIGCFFPGFMFSLPITMVWAGYRRGAPGDGIKISFLHWLLSHNHLLDRTVEEAAKPRSPVAVMRIPQRIDIATLGVTSPLHSLTPVSQRRGSLLQ